MGLFGGFKAKFTSESAKNTKASTKTAKKSEVVCLGYRVYSEFENFPHYSQSQAFSSTKRSSGVKTVLSKSEPKINNASKSVTPSAIVTNPKVKPVKKRVEISKIEKNENSKTELSSNNQKSSIKTTNLASFEEKTNTFTSSSSMNQSTSIQPVQKQPSKSILKASSIELTEQEVETSTVNTNNYLKHEPSDAISNEDSNDLGSHSQEEPVEYSKVTLASVKKTEPIEDTSNNNDKTNYTQFVSKNYGYSQNGIGATSRHAANLFFDYDYEEEVANADKINDLQSKDNFSSA